MTRIWVATLFRVDGETVSLVLFLLTDSTLIRLLGATFVNIMTHDNVAMLTWLSCYKSDPDHLLPGFANLQQAVTESGKLNYLFADIIVQLAKFSRFEEYLTRHGKIQICKIVDRRRHSTKVSSCGRQQ